MNTIKAPDIAVNALNALDPCRTLQKLIQPAQSVKNQRGQTSGLWLSSVPYIRLIYLHYNL